MWKMAQKQQAVTYLMTSLEAYLLKCFCGTRRIVEPNGVTEMFPSA